VDNFNENMWFPLLSQPIQLVYKLIEVNLERHQNSQTLPGGWGVLTLLIGLGTKLDQD